MSAYGDLIRAAMSATTVEELRAVLVSLLEIMERIDDDLYNVNVDDGPIDWVLPVEEDMGASKI